MEIERLKELVDYALSFTNNYCEDAISDDDTKDAIATFNELTTNMCSDSRMFKQKLARLDAWYQVLQEKPTLENVVSVLSDVISSSRKEIADALQSINSQKM